jgi:hypothetical protein
MNTTVLTRTVTFIVRQELGVIPVRACIEIVGSEVSPAPGGSLSWMSSMMNNCLHTNLWPFVKNSLQWKQRSSLRHSAISVVVRRLMEGGGLVPTALLGKLILRVLMAAVCGRCCDSAHAPAVVDRHRGTPAATQRHAQR